MGGRIAVVVTATLFVGVGMMGCLFFGGNPANPLAPLSHEAVLADFCTGFIGLNQIVARALSGGSTEGDPNTDKDDTEDQAAIRLYGGVTGFRGWSLTNDPDIVGLLDTDDDGLPDAWERRHFGDLSRDGSGDLDLDGVSDRVEYRQGSDPTSASDSTPAPHPKGHADMGDGGMGEGGTSLADIPFIAPSFNNCIPRRDVPDDIFIQLHASLITFSEHEGEEGDAETMTESEIIEFFELGGIVITFDVYRYNRDGEPIFQNAVQATTTEDGMFSLFYEPTPEFGRFRFEVTDMWRDDASWTPEFDQVEPFDEVVLYF